MQYITFQTYLMMNPYARFETIVASSLESSYILTLEGTLAEATLCVHSHDQRSMHKVSPSSNIKFQYLRITPRFILPKGIMKNNINSKFLFKIQFNHSTK